MNAPKTVVAVVPWQRWAHQLVWSALTVSSRGVEGYAVLVEGIEERPCAWGDRERAGRCGRICVQLIWCHQRRVVLTEFASVGSSSRTVPSRLPFSSTSPIFFSMLSPIFSGEQTVRVRADSPYSRAPSPGLLRSLYPSYSPPAIPGCTARRDIHDRGTSLKRCRVVQTVCHGISRLGRRSVGVVAPVWWSKRESRLARAEGEGGARGGRNVFIHRGWERLRVCDGWWDRWCRGYWRCGCRCRESWRAWWWRMAVSRWGCNG